MQSLSSVETQNPSVFFGRASRPVQIIRSRCIVFSQEDRFLSDYTACIRLYFRTFYQIWRFKLLERPRYFNNNNNNRSRERERAREVYNERLFYFIFAIIVYIISFLRGFITFIDRSLP